MRAGAAQTTIRTEQDMSTFKESAIKDGDRIDAADIPSALTRAPFNYANGATQVFTSDGRTVYTERGKPSPGEWKVDDRSEEHTSALQSLMRISYDVFCLQHKNK